MQNSEYVYFVCNNICALIITLISINMLVHIFFFLVLLGEEKEKGERQRGKRKTDIEVAECHTSLLLFSLVEKIYSSPI